MNYKHLYYFWACAKAGGILRAGDQLHISPQTLSGQIKLLEDRLGCALFRKSGRGLELTEDGRTALRYADEIFALGAELEAALGREKAEAVATVFRVGISDAVPKAIAYHLLEPALALPTPVRLACHEGKMQDLLAQLSVNRLDLVIADEAMGAKTSIRAYNHRLGGTSMSFFAAPELAGRLLKQPFPDCLQDAPILLQSRSSAMRQRLDIWLSEKGVRPKPVGEFDDAALILAFGSEGRGVFMAPTVLEAETQRQHGVEPIGRSSELVEEFFGISIERKIKHPCVVAITEAARSQFLDA